MKQLHTILILLIFPLTLSAKDTNRADFFDTYPIIQAEHPTLRMQAADFDLHRTQTDQFETYVKDLFTTMKRNSGIGLAAPQINRSERIFVIGATLSRVKKRIFINPEVEFIGEPSKISLEGCLSTKDYGYRNVPRYKKVFVRYYDEQGQYQEKEFSGFTAIVIQHEYDHLMGKLIIDYPQANEEDLLKHNPVIL